MSEYLIKRSVEKDGLPKKPDYYFCDDKRICFFNGHNFFDSNGDYPQFWYEPTTLPEIIERVMPTEGEIEEEVNKLTPQSKGFYYEQRIWGINWLKTKLTKQQEQ